MQALRCRNRVLGVALFPEVDTVLGTHWVLVKYILNVGGRDDCMSGLKWEADTLFPKDTIKETPKDANLFTAISPFSSISVTIKNTFLSRREFGVGGVLFFL